MTGDDLLARAQADFFGMFRMLARKSSTGEVREQDGLLVAATGVPLRSFNNVFVSRPLQDPASLLSDALAHVDGRKVPFRLRVREGTDPATEGAVLEHGLQWIGTIPELALDPITSKTSLPPLKIRCVTEPAALDDHVAVVAGGFDMPPSLLRQVFSNTLIDEATWRGYVGYVDGRPVAASQLFITDGVAGIFYVATLESFRRRGFGEAMTWHAVQDGAEAGYNVAVLQASDMGRPIYERMGFRVIGAYKTFARPDPPAEEEV